MPTAHVRWIGDMKFEGIDSNGHMLLMEASSQYGGAGEGVTPVEMLLSALGGCTGVAIVGMLKHRGQKVTSLEVDLDGVRKISIPRLFESVRLKFKIKGDFDEKLVNNIVDLVMTDISPVAEMISGPTDVKWVSEIT
ncbi:MAG: OsmC family protein [Candidatus Methanomethylicus sp.]|nr:OsmC family protein [Candidatus Methanomethylicus sp.]